MNIDELLIEINQWDLRDVRDLQEFLLDLGEEESEKRRKYGLRIPKDLILPTAFKTSRVSALSGELIHAIDIEGRALSGSHFEKVIDVSEYLEKSRNTEPPKIRPPNVNDIS